MSEQSGTTTDQKLTEAVALLSNGDYVTARITNAFGEPKVEIIETTRPSSVSEVAGPGLCVWLLQSKARVLVRIEGGGLSFDVKDGGYGGTWQPVASVEHCAVVEHRGPTGMAS